MLVMPQRVARKSYRVCSRHRGLHSVRTDPPLNEVNTTGVLQTRGYNEPEWLLSLNTSSKQRLCCYLKMVAAMDDGGYENTGVPREDQFARATRETVTPEKDFGFMLDDGVRLYHRSWAASR